MHKTIKFSRSNKNLKSIHAAKLDIEDFKAKQRKAHKNRLSKKSSFDNTIIYRIAEARDPLETAFDLLVPSEGKADTKAGELVRAIMRIMYRDFNDGDVFYEGYGIETCGDAVAFLCDKIPALESKFEDIAMRVLEGVSYTESIQEIADIVIEKILDNPNLVTEKNDEDMFTFDGEQFIKDHEWEPEYEFECDLPDNVYAHIEAENISDGDVEYEIESWGVMENGSVRVQNGEVYINGLSRYEYDELESTCYNTLEEWGTMLTDDYGDPYESEDEEED